MALPDFEEVENLVLVSIQAIHTESFQDYYINRKNKNRFEKLTVFKDTTLRNFKVASITIVY